MAVRLDDLRKVAEDLALSNSQADSEISRVIWFPADEEVRLLEVHDAVPAGDPIVPFHFPPAQPLGIPYPCAIALVSENDIGEMLPPSWGSWEDGVTLFTRQSQ